MNDLSTRLRHPTAMERGPSSPGNLGSGNLPARALDRMLERSTLGRPDPRRPQPRAAAGPRESDRAETPAGRTRTTWIRHADRPT